MINVARKARPRRSPNRVALVNLDGTTPARPIGPAAAGWPGWTDNWHWEPGECADDLASHVTLDAPDDDES